jgi:hypothetical protein
MTREKQQNKVAIRAGSRVSLPFFPFTTATMIYMSEPTIPGPRAPPFPPRVFFVVQPSEEVEERST